MVQEMDAKIVHIHREVNRRADVLAHMKSEQTEEQARMLIPPNDVVEEIMCDLRRVAYG